MLKKITFAGLGLALLVLPAFASAGSACPILSRSLSRGMNGTDVVSLQNYLIGEGVLSAGLNTGYFGALTAGALVNWQSAHGISAIGIAGPATRAAIAAHCGPSSSGTGSGTSTKIVSLIPVPASGQAPLLVALDASGLTQGTTYTVDFGDGTTASLTGNPPPCVYGNDCSSTLVNAGVSHTYASAGTYTATLQYQPPCPPGLSCTQVLQVVASATVTVSSATGGTTSTTGAHQFSAAHQSGIAPLAFTFSATSLTQSTRYFVDYGDGSADAVTLNAPPCAAGNDCSNGYSFAMSHTYQKTGTYTATLTGNTCPPGADCFVGPQTVATITVTANYPGN